MGNQMNNRMEATSLVQTWVPVTDEQGRVHLEAHWDVATPAPSHAAHAA